MAMDLTVAEYADYDATLAYMEGSAAVIGTMMLPILDPADPAAAREPARQLGLAFQLTNFIRDVGEDLDRGRVYLPQADLARFGLSPEDLRESWRRREATPAVRELVAFEIGRARRHYAAAAPGIPMLAGSSQPCIRAAYAIYGGILDEIEAADHDVFARRAVVPTGRRLRLLAKSFLAAPSAPVALPREV
jgi:phytoene synthase